MIATQTGSGAWFMISYATYFMTVAGLTLSESFEFSIMNSCLGLVGVNLGIYAMRQVAGRQTILMTGAVFQGLCMLGMALGATTRPGTVTARNCVVAFSALFMFGYNALVGNATYPTATEMVSTRLRSWTVGSAISLGYLLAWLTGFCSPYFINPSNLDWASHSRTLHSYLCRRCLTVGHAGGPVWLHMGEVQSGLPCFFFPLRSRNKGQDARRD